MLTYIEPCGWCSSSISSRKSPSNVDKLIEPCPHLSSSLASTSLISNSDNISIGTDSLSYEKRRRRTSTYLARSSLKHPNDYHTTKRIDQLHERMDDIQIRSFLKFINYHLSLKKDEENLQINDLVKDLSNGHVLIDLIEIFSSTKLKRERGHTRFHSLINVRYVLDYLKLHMEHINISPHEIVEGNRKQILALLWIIMKRFDFPAFRLTNKNCFVENTLLGFGQDRSIILKWLNHILNQSLHTQQIYIKDFYLQTWLTSSYLSIILKYLIPLSLKYLTIKCFDYLKELNYLNIFNQEYFQICLNLSNYCFNTITIINYTDQSEKCLFKYFTELQENILNIIKTNHIEKLMVNNPYMKQILETVSQTTEHSSYIMNDNEQYLVCIEDEKVTNLRTVDEQEKMKFKRTNRLEKTENMKSHSHMINGHNETSKEKQVEEITDKSQQLNDTAEELDQPVLSVEKIEQETNDQTKPDQPIVTDKETEQMSVSQINGKLEQITTLEEDIEQPAENQNSTATDEELEYPTTIVEESTQSVVLSEKAEEPQEQAIASDEEDKQSTNEYEKFEQTLPSVEHIEQSRVAVEEQKQCLTSSENVKQRTSTVSENETEEAQQVVTSNEENNKPTIEHEKLEQTLSSAEDTGQSIVAVEEQKECLTFSENTEIGPVEQTTSTMSENEMEEAQQPIILNEENDKSTIEHEKLEQSIENKPSITTNEESLQSSIENNHYLSINENLEQSTIEEPSQIVLLDEQNVTKIGNNTSSIPTNVSEELDQFPVVESPPPILSNEEITIKGIDNENFVTSNGKLEQPIIDHEETKQLTDEHEKSNQSLGPIEKTEQAPVPFVQNDSATINEKLEQSTVQESSQAIISNEKTTITPVENNPSIMTSKKLEKLTVIESQQPIALNGQINKSTTSNKKSTAINKKSIPIASSVQHFTTSNEQSTQSTIVVKEPEQRQNVFELPVQTAAITSQCPKYSDIVNKQPSKTNNESVQETASFKKQEHATVSKKKAISPVMSSEKSRQSVITAADEAEQVPSTGTIQETEQSTMIIEELPASAVSNEETKKSPMKNKKSRRSNAKKAKAKHSSVKTENPEQFVINNEEDDEPLSPLLNPTNIVQEQKPNSETENSSTIHQTPSDDHTSMNNDNPPNSSALRSRKNKRKKTTATTTTTLIEKSSSPIIPTTAPNRNLFVVIRECIRDQKISAFKCVIILVCLCFSIIIIVLSHK